MCVQLCVVCVVVKFDTCCRISWLSGGVCDEQSAGPCPIKDRNTVSFVQETVRTPSRFSLKGQREEEMWDTGTRELTEHHNSYWFIFLVDQQIDESTEIKPSPTAVRPDTWSWLIVSQSQRLWSLLDSGATVSTETFCERLEVWDEAEDQLRAPKTNRHTDVLVFGSLEGDERLHQTTASLFVCFFQPPAVRFISSSRVGMQSGVCGSADAVCEIYIPSQQPCAGLAAPPTGCTAHHTVCPGMSLKPEGSRTFIVCERSHSGPKSWTDTPKLSRESWRKVHLVLKYNFEVLVRVFPFCATYYVYSSTSQKEIFYFLLYYIYSTTLVII